MGWNSWNTYGCDINETKIMAQADAMVDKTIFGDDYNVSLSDLGFSYIIIDDCWQSRSRDGDGWLNASHTRFPSGMGALVDYIHSKGLLAGLYSSAGTKSCAGYPGSLGNEQNDALQLAFWQVDYLKYDNCYNEGIPAETRYSAMSYAINSTGEEEFRIFYSLCNWGNEQVWNWAPDFAHSWRTTVDIALGGITKSNAWFQVVANFKNNMLHADKAGPGHWNDPDMLVLGWAELTKEEARTHWAMWCFSKAPLILSMDLNNIGDFKKDDSIAYVLHNSTEILKVNQDGLGKQAK